MALKFPFGQEVHPVIQENNGPKKVFVLGVYASAVHALWKDNDGRIKCRALAVASEPRIFWDGNREEAEAIIRAIDTKGFGTLKPAAKGMNGPSAKALDEDILRPCGLTRKDAWLCDLLPESRLNDNQQPVIEGYNKECEAYGLEKVDIASFKRPKIFCNKERCDEILKELEESQADTLILLGDIPIKQFLNRVADVDFSTLGQYDAHYGYGNPTSVRIGERQYKILPLAHPRQIAALGNHSPKWKTKHEERKKKGFTIF